MTHEPALSASGIGTLLVQRGCLTEERLHEALRLQQSQGGLLGEILTSHGWMRAMDFYRLLASHKGLGFLDMQETPCDTSLLLLADRPAYLRLLCLPWREENGHLYIATAHPGEEVEAWAKERFLDAKQITFVVTTPRDIFHTLREAFAKNDDIQAREKLWREEATLSARTLVPGRGTFAAIALFIGLLVALLSVSSAALATLFLVLNLFYAMTLLSKVLFFVTGWVVEKRPGTKAKPPPLWQGPEKSLPVYTLLVPLYQEKTHTIERLLQSIRQLHYPKTRLDVKLIVEEDDLETQRAIKQQRCESYFQIVPVPASLPRTKPKACNYALQFARGEYVVIYDAEDQPDPDQLLGALWHFKHGPANLACVQARLNYYNRNEHWLARFFALEYGAWFHFMLPGLQQLKIPIPLGGTSNHFPLHVLHALHAWDPYNVTEDADLGIRLAQQGYVTRMMDSLTLEEAPIGIWPWIKQRSRWIKGYIQTFMVHMRRPLRFIRITGWTGTLGFLLFVGAPAVVFLTMIPVGILSAFVYTQNVALPEWFFWIAFANLWGALAVHMIMAMVVIIRDRWWRLLWMAPFFPFYWLLHVGASFKSLWELLMRPHYWDKTEHGVSKHSR